MFDNEFEELRLTGSLPTQAGVGLAILRITQRSTHDPAEILRILRTDPVLTGRLLKLANEGAESGQERCTSAVQAASRLGRRTTRDVALGFSLVSTASAGTCPEFDYDRFWAISLCSALVAEALARSSPAPGVHPEEAYTCALLSRIGMLALATAHSSQYSQILRETRGKPLSAIVEAEANAFEITHPEVTAAMMTDWGLPETFIVAATNLGLSGRQGEKSAGSSLPLLDLMNVAWRSVPLVLGELREGSTEERMITAACSQQLMNREYPSGCYQEGLAAAKSGWLSWARVLHADDGHASAVHDSPPVQEPLAAEKTITWTTTQNPSPTAYLSSYGPLAPQVLVVDDDERIIRLLTHVLERDGFRVIAARSGDRARVMAIEQRPQIVITDWMMPGLSGIELCRELKASDTTRDSYVIILTAREEEDRVIESFDAGADDHVAKPFNPMILLSRVRAGFRVLLLQKQIDNDRDVRARQMAEMGAASRKLRSISLTDALTELPNRRYARQRLDEAWRSSTYSGRPLSLVLIDVDRFKDVNDSCGHDIGDQVLAEIATVLRLNVREGDIVCRFGGEEFLVITVDAGVDLARQCAERLRQAVATHEFGIAGFERRMTISLGVAERKPGMTGVLDLIRSADQAVYRAKETGRDRTIVGGGECERAAAG